MVDAVKWPGGSAKPSEVSKADVAMLHTNMKVISGMAETNAKMKATSPKTGDMGSQLGVKVK